MSSTALIVRTQQSKALVHRYTGHASTPSSINILPGRTLNEIYDSLGSVAEGAANRAAHRLGMGPFAVVERISGYFDAGGVKGREKKICGLPDLRDKSASVPTLRKDCAKLLAYTVPTQTPRTQIDALFGVIDVATRCPGLRHFFLATKLVERKVASPVTINGLCAFWTPQLPPDHEDAKELDFVIKLAATCLADSNIASLVEASPTQNSRVEGCNGGLTVIEYLLITLWSRALSEPSVSLSLRYLGGILELPSFWLQSGPLFDSVLRKVGESASQILQDLDIQQTEVDTGEFSMDVDGLDILFTALLSGFHDMVVHRGIQATVQEHEWHRSMLQVVASLRFPKAEALLPNANAWAMSALFQQWFLTPYQVQEFTVVVPLTEDNVNELDEGYPHQSRVVPVEEGEEALLGIRRVSLASSDESILEELDMGLLEWANAHLPSSLHIVDPAGALYNGLGLLRLAEAINGTPSSPPVPDSAFPQDPTDDNQEGLYRLFDFLMNNGVPIGSVRVNDIRYGRRDKVLQVLLGLKSWEDRQARTANPETDGYEEEDDEEDDWDFVDGSWNEDRNGPATSTSLFARGVVDKYRLAVFRKPDTSVGNGRPRALSPPRSRRNLQYPAGKWSVSVAESAYQEGSYSIYVKTPTHNLTLSRTATELLDLNHKLQETRSASSLPELPWPAAPTRPKTWTTRLIPTKPSLPPPSLTIPNSASVIASYLTSVSNTSDVRQARAWKRFVKVRADDLESVRVERAIKRVRSNV